MASLGKFEDVDLLEGLDVGFLKRFGLWGIINHYREKGYHGDVCFRWMLMTTVLFIPLYISSVIGPFYVEKSLEGQTVTLLNPLTTMQMAVKFSVLWFSIDSLAQLIELFKSDFVASLPREMRLKAHEIMTQAAKKATSVSNMCIYVNFFVIFFWNTMPVVRSEFFRENYGTWIFGTPVGHNKILGFWYPGPMDDTPLVQIIYCYEFVTCFWAGLIITLFEALAAQLIIILTGRFNVVQRLLMEDESSSSSTLSTETPEDILNLQILIKEHQQLLKIGNQLRSVFDFPITILLATGLLILIIGIFNFILGSGNGDPVMMFKFMIYTAYTLLEVTVYCVAGSGLECASSDVVLAAYYSEWYKKGPRFRKILVFIMTRSRNPVFLLAGRVYRVNHSVLTNILQMAYSTSMFLFKLTRK